MRKTVIPAQAGIQHATKHSYGLHWIPACAGMTSLLDVVIGTLLLEFIAKEVSIYHRLT